MLKRAIKWLRGKKTYITVGITIASTGVGYYTGEITASAAVQIGLTALFAALLRDGMKTEAAKQGVETGV